LRVRWLQPCKWAHIRQVKLSASRRLDNCISWVRSIDKSSTTSSSWPFKAELSSSSREAIIIRRNNKQGSERPQKVHNSPLSSRYQIFRPAHSFLNASPGRKSSRSSAGCATHREHSALPSSIDSMPGKLSPPLNVDFADRSNRYSSRNLALTPTGQAKDRGDREYGTQLFITEVGSRQTYRGTNEAKLVLQPDPEGGANNRRQSDRNRPPERSDRAKRGVSE
jgi:hypothetical protein